MVLLNPKLITSFSLSLSNFTATSYVPLGKIPSIDTNVTFLLSTYVLLVLLLTVTYTVPLTLFWKVTVIL